jgi:Uma2 family endonuclease
MSLQLQEISPTIKELEFYFNGTETQSEDGMFVSEELYWEEYYDHPDFNYEWNNGYLEEKPVADYSKVKMYCWFSDVLRGYLRVHPVAKFTALEMGARLPLPHKTAIRKPDLGLVLNSNLIPLKDDDRTYHGIYDLCVESLSDSNKHAIERDTVQKWGEYEAVGIQEYYILDDHGVETTFLENVGGIYLPITQVNGIVHSKVLSGFQFRVNDLYRQPGLIELTDDPVYQGFILLEHQAEKRRAEQESRRAERESRRAERERQARVLAQHQVKQERQVKERLAAKLRELGIDPDRIQ